MARSRSSGPRSSSGFPGAERIAGRNRVGDSSPAGGAPVGGIQLTSWKKSHELVETFPEGAGAPHNRGEAVPSNRRRGAT